MLFARMWRLLYQAGTAPAQLRAMTEWVLLSAVPSLSQEREKERNHWRLTGFPTQAFGSGADALPSATPRQRPFQASCLE